MNPKQKESKVFYVTNQSRFGSISVPMEVLGLVVIKHENDNKPGTYSEPIMCFKLREPDGTIEFYPVSNDYQLITMPESE